MERDQASKFINDLLKLMVARKGSDLFITADFPPAIKVDGKVTRLMDQPLVAAHTLTLARSIMSDRQVAEFERTKECNFAISPAGIGRFRVNTFMQQGRVGMVLRRIPADIPSIDRMGLPQVLKEVAMTKRGLCIFVGATGSGKSTSLAAMVDWRNEHSEGHIITIEDPIEFVYPHKNCIVTQREVGLDTDSWEAALKNSLRQAPDVILMGEIRDRETMEHAIVFSETGHLCLATLHANSANQALDRIINFFPEERREQLLLDLSLNLRAMISQRLLARENEKGRVAAMEVLLNTPAPSATKTRCAMRTQSTTCACRSSCTASVRTTPIWRLAPSTSACCRPAPCPQQPTRIKKSRTSRDFLSACNCHHFTGVISTTGSASCTAGAAVPCFSRASSRAL